MKELAKKDGIDDMQSWDLAYYSQKLKKLKFDFDSEDLILMQSPCQGF